MASGVPCILSANTGHLDLIEDDNCYPITNQAEISSLPYIRTGESSVDEIVELLCRFMQTSTKPDYAGTGNQVHAGLVLGKTDEISN